METTGCNALELVRNERQAQMDKHGFDAAHDDQLTHDELTEAAMAVLTEDPERWPRKMSVRIFHNASEKGEAERRVVAAALLCADIDRILRERARVGPPPQLVAGGRARLRPDLYDQCMNHGMDPGVCEHLATMRGTACTVERLDNKHGEALVKPDAMSGTVTLPQCALIPLEQTQPENA